MTVRTPACTHAGLGSFHFARRYFGNRCFFLFLSLLRCFSSGGSQPAPMDSVQVDRSLSCQVSPFRDLRVKGYLLLTAAYRSLSRLSSALSAKASTLRPSLLYLILNWISKANWTIDLSLILFRESVNRSTRSFYLILFGVFRTPKGSVITLRHLRWLRLMTPHLRIYFVNSLLDIRCLVNI